MNKFKLWLIKKLGGYTPNEYKVVKIRYALDQEYKHVCYSRPIVTIKSSYVMNGNIINDLAPDDLENMIRYKLAKDIARQIEPDLKIKSIQSDLVPHTTFTTSIKIAKE